MNEGNSHVFIVTNINRLTPLARKRHPLLFFFLTQSVSRAVSSFCFNQLCRVLHGVLMLKLV